MIKEVLEILENIKENQKHVEEVKNSFKDKYFLKPRDTTIKKNPKKTTQNPVYQEKRITTTDDRFYDRIGEKLTVTKCSWLCIFA